MPAKPGRDVLPYSRQLISDADVEAVVRALRAPIISQGAELDAFEAAFAAYVGVAHAVAFSSGTAALHGMCHAAGLGPGDEVVLPALTFAGTANAVLYTGATPVFADIDPATRCLDPASARAACTDRTRALLTVDFAGRASDYAALRAICDERGLVLLSDAAHAAGARYAGRRVGSLAEMTAFSFNPVKNMTAAEAGLVTTPDAGRAAHLRAFRNHGFVRDPGRLVREAPGAWYYEQQMLGFNYKLSELHAALGRSQLARLEAFNRRRGGLAARYHEALAGLPLARPQPVPAGEHAWHLYVVEAEDEAGRGALFAHLRRAGIGVQLHYVPVPSHPFYQTRGHTMDGLPHTAAYAARALSLPLHPAMTDADLDGVVAAVRDGLG